LCAKRFPPRQMESWPLASSPSTSTRRAWSTWSRCCFCHRSTGFVHLATGYPEPDWDTVGQMVEAEPFFRYVLHDGLARAGRADLIAGLCRDWSVFLDAGETTWPECWRGGTRCHGWSSTPTRAPIVHPLGIAPAEPGYGAVRVAPALGDLEWARATVPTPHGPVTVEARADGTIQVDSPVPVVRPREGRTG